ncbi:glycosyltransferase family 2 protein [Cohnella xylanilytica]|uniref:Glycosyltransferase family 2 protein n=2 Tax=Cohnella xylanilytica TaxID=557555 RepID=A0A841TZ01_9BACL|nr:glycosyltransferase family 2 protein [Cohnella xylanilytica]
MPLVSIVMLCWNRLEDVRESLTRIRLIEYPELEVIVVDNGSTDGTPEMIEREFPEVRLLRMTENIGIAAYNRGFERARGEYLVIIDDDSFPAPKAIGRMVRKFERDPDLGVVAFDVRNFYHYDEVAQVEEPESSAKDSSATAAHYYMSFNGAGVGIRTNLFRRVGFYPEEFFLYNNEMDSAFRIWDAGYRIEFHSDVVAYHKYSPVNRTSWRAPYYYVRNAFWLVWKNYPAPMALRLTRSLLFKCVHASLEQRTWIYLKAMRDAFRQANLIQGKRKPVREEIALNLRVPYDVFFTFYR